MPGIVRASRSGISLYSSRRREANSDILDSSYDLLLIEIHPVSQPLNTAKKTKVKLIGIELTRDVSLKNCQPLRRISF